MKLEPLSKADLLKVKAINDYHLYNDPRPLTDETLEELGFHKVKKWWIYRPFVYQNDKQFVELIALKKEDNTYIVTMDNNKSNTIWKTVGSVRMLIESLKGDE